MTDPRAVLKRAGLTAKRPNPMIEIGTKDTAWAMRATPVAVAIGTWKTSVRANWTAAWYPPTPPGVGTNRPRTAAVVTTNAAEIGSSSPNARMMQ